MGPMKIRSFYMRMWIARIVFIADSKDGLKKSQKDGHAFKLLLGIVSD